jgi:hypothetical protein
MRKKKYRQTQTRLTRATFCSSTCLADNIITSVTLVKLRPAVFKYAQRLHKARWEDKFSNTNIKPSSDPPGWHPANIRGATQVRALTSLHPDVPASFRYLCPLIPHGMPATHSLDLCPLYVGFLPNTPLRFFPSPSQTNKTATFLGHPELLFLSPIGSFGGRVRARRFHSIPRRANGNWGPLFHFPYASYTIQNLWPAGYIGRWSECKTSILE